MKTLIALTGSFNPVTIAHYSILSDAVSKYNADEGIFIATNDTYLNKKCLLNTKPATTFILPETTRRTMLSSLASDNPKLTYWGTELGGADPSTYKTLAKLYKDKKRQYPGEELKLMFLFGADKLKAFPHWKDVDKIIELCDILVYARNFDLEATIQSNDFLKAHRDQIHLMETDNDELEEVSSTEVRRRFFNGEDYRNLMNEGPYQVMQALSPADFPPVDAEMSIQAQLKYGGRFGKNAARTEVYKANAKLFSTWTKPFLGEKEPHLAATVYDQPFMVNAPALPNATVTACINEDCIEMAKSLLDEGFNPAILNLASLTSPGGYYHKGFGAQEESLCQASTLSQSLYQFGNTKYKHIRESGLTNIPGVYPMDLNFGGIYSPCVTFFRNNLDHDFTFREQAFDCPVVTVASLSNRHPKDEINEELKYFDADGHLTAEGKDIESNKIRTLFRIALQNGHDSMVLGAFGCGAYCMDSAEVATLFRDVLEEKEFKNRFKKLIFAIYEGIPSPRKAPMGRESKFGPFYTIFD